MSRPPPRRSRNRQFFDRMQAIHPGLDEAEIREWLSLKRPSTVRLNPLKAEPEELRARLENAGHRLAPLPWCAEAGVLESEKRALSESAFFTSGEVYLQNASSLIPVLALDPQPGERVLDVCAAPGGKASHIAARMQNQGELWLNDSIKPRREKLEGLMATYGVHGEITGHPGQYIDKFLEGPFDRILLDAQCSGEGLLDFRHESALRYWEEARIIKMSFLQKKMLTAAWKLLRPGGVLVYSTCTFAPEENEAPVSRLLGIRDDARIEPLLELNLPSLHAGLVEWQGEQFSNTLAWALRVRPDALMDPFFVCRLRKG